MLPEELDRIIQKQIEGISLKKLLIASEELSHHYKESEKSFFQTPIHRLAYLCCRFPATYAAIYSVIEELKKRVSPISVSSILDIGAGYAPSLWVFSLVFPEISRFTLLERDKEIVKTGKKLYLSKKEKNFETVTWIEEDFTSSLTIPSHDLLLFSYSLGELNSPLYLEALKKFFHLANSFLIIIEPGTPEGFGRIKEMRELLISLGGYIVAPCPHQEACPIQGKDWCHFSKRLSRSSFHRMIKRGELGYEDEKFSYLIVSKQPHMVEGKRIIRTPFKQKGKISLDLCTSDGIKKTVITKKDKNNYKQTKKLKWGDFIQ